MLSTTQCIVDVIEMKTLAEAVDYLLQQHGLSYTVTIDTDAPSATMVFFKTIVGTVKDVLDQLAASFGCKVSIVEAERLIAVYVNPFFKTYL